MKKLAATLMIALGALMLPALAQDFSTSRDGGRGNDFIQDAFPDGQQPLSNNAVPIKPFDPKPTGALNGLYRNGLIMLSPLAPTRYGYGTQYLSKYPAQNPYFALTSGTSTNPEFGGIELLGWDF